MRNFSADGFEVLDAFHALGHKERDIHRDRRPKCRCHAGDQRQHLPVDHRGAAHRGLDLIQLLLLTRNLRFQQLVVDVQTIDFLVDGTELIRDGTRLGHDAIDTRLRLNLSLQTRVLRINHRIDALRCGRRCERCHCREEHADACTASEPFHEISSMVVLYVAIDWYTRATPHAGTWVWGGVPCTTALAGLPIELETPSRPSQYCPLITEP